jgi:tRNA threonylcarbamoyladenosine biosynthesis protein TsaE
MLQLCSDSPATTHAIAAEIAAVVRRGDIIVIAGEMGAGKTAFAQGFGSALGVTEHMTSPTFNLVHSHPVVGRAQGKLTLHHADVYRLNTQHEVDDLALAELAEADGVVLVEWGDVVANSLGDHLLVRLAPADSADEARDGEDRDEASTRRLITVAAVGRAWAVRWQSLTTALVRFAC